MPTTLPLTIVTLATLLVLPACDDKEEPKRADLQAPAKTKDGKKDGATPSSPVADGRVFFVKPVDGATVPEQFEVEFGVEGKQIRPAGAPERDPAFGHHHLLIGVGPIDDMAIVPKNETHLHYGAGETKTTVKLSPGKHQLTMQLADGAHRSYGADWAATISVEVQAAGAAQEGADAATAADAAAPAADGAGADAG